MFTEKTATKLPLRKPLHKVLFNQVVLGDCVKYLGQLPSHIKFDLVIADPPYNIGKNFGNNQDNLSLKHYVRWSVRWIKLCLDRLKEDGLLYVYGFSEILSHISVNFPLQRQKWLVWHYTNKTVPTLKFWQRSHETIICFWNGKQNLIWRWIRLESLIP